MNGDGLPPGWIPPGERRWVFRGNVPVFSSLPSHKAELQIAPAWDGRRTYDYGTNWGDPAAGADPIHYGLEKWHFAQAQFYHDDVETELMAIEQDKSSGSQYFAVYAGDSSVRVDPSVGASPYWPHVWTFTYTNYVIPPAGGTWYVRIVKIMADVWVSVPGNVTNIGTLNPKSPLIDQAQTGIALIWPRRNERVVVDMNRLGGLGGLTWEGRNSMWTGEKVWLLDGYRLVYEALPGGGHRREAEYRFTKVPGAPDPVGGGGGGGGGGGTTPTGYFILDVTALDDPDYPIA